MSETAVQNLFGEAAAMAAIPAPKKSRADIQREKSRKLYEATAEAWKNATYDFAVNKFLPVNQTFIFEELTLQYEAAARTQRLPRTVEPRAFAGLQSRLKREALIEEVPGETRDRTQGSPSQLYRSLVWRER